MSRVPTEEYRETPPPCAARLSSSPRARSPSARRMGHCVAIASWLFAVHVPAVAQPTGSPSTADPSADAEARAHYQAGQLAFDQGRFENALESFRMAYALSQRPELLYNIASAADRLRQDPAHWKRFDVQGARRWFFKVAHQPEAVTRWY